MRITTHMLNESARKAGLPTNNTSLLNYINSDNSNNSLLETLNSGNKTKAQTDTVGRKNYEKLEKEADNLTQSTITLLQKNENNLFAQARECGNNQKIYDGIDRFFDDYNNTMQALKKVSGGLNDFYRQMLSETPEKMKDRLESIGITFRKDGTADVDMEKVREADLETLETLFGSKSEFVEKVSFVAGRIADNAGVNVESLSNSYNSNGNLYRSISGGKYDLRG